MNNFKKTLLNELPEFKDYTLNFLNGNISKMQYKSFSGGYGVYAQRDKKSFMIRLRTSCGVISRCQLHTIYQMANKHNLESIHLTTRQAIQLHDLDVDAVVDIMKTGIEKCIFTRGGGGNYPRNVGLSPLSGVDTEDIFDVTPYALATDKYFLNKITTYHLPRKLKVSYSSSDKDFAHATVQDLGFVATTKNGKPYFKVYVGGGLGRNPRLGIKLDELVNTCDVLYYVEGLTEFFAKEGNYENKNRARLRYLVEDFGEEEFINKFKKYVDEQKQSKNLKINPTPIDYNKEGSPIDCTNPRLIKQKQPNLYTVYIHPVGGIYKLKNLKSLLYELDKIKNPIIRIGMMEEMYILNLDGNEAKKILEITENTSGSTLLENSISCIGTPICQMGICDSQKMLSDIITHFKINSRDHKNLEVMPKIYISGCGNSCGVHQIGCIGFTGRMKKIDNIPTHCFEMSINGKFAVGQSKLGETVGEFKCDDIPAMLYEISEKLVEKNIDFKSLTQNYREEFNKIIDKYNLV